MKKVCLITNGHLSCNPRIVKEADALQEAGYETIVISTEYVHSLLDYDDSLVRTKKWLSKRLLWSKEGRSYLHMKTGLRHAIYRLLPSAMWSFLGSAEKALGRVTAELTSIAMEEKADLYVGHNLAALPVAAKAAKKNNAKLGFDAEDFHSGEFEAPRKLVRLIEFIEKKYFPRCDYITAASEPIADAYASKYNIKKPVVVLNVFPLNLLQGALCPPHPGLLLYWFSQTIGPGRGIEEVITAMGKTKNEVQLYLQGTIDLGYKRKLAELAMANKVEQKRIIYLEMASQEGLFKTALQFDVGLALERRQPLNRDLCVTNKIFTYLLSGLSVIATDTQGQRPIVEDIGKAGWIYKPGDVDSLAKRLGFLLENKQELEDSKQWALKNAKEKYNWDMEKKVYLTIVESVLKT